MSLKLSLPSALTMLSIFIAVFTINAAEQHHPANWRFTMPKGEVAKGRAIFQKFECYSCHRINGEPFPEPFDSAPELSQMGPLHPLEYFTESVIHPNAVVARQWRERDGNSPMSQEHIATMTLRELIDLSSYLASLKPPSMPKLVTGVGKIVAVMPQSQEVVIDHEEIKGFMDAMIMGYKLASRSQLQGLNPGDVVTFTIETGKRVITKIAKAKK
ncbi:MAG: c-type cytochrome [Deltaproteobacteria bacterium]|nr:c-type cytochrome [Deltaproteobacteria bacterium]